MVGEKPNAATSRSVPSPDLVVEVGQRYRLTIPAGFDMDAAVHLLRGLA